MSVLQRSCPNSCLLLAAALLFGGCATEPAVRIGTFDTRAVALAYGRSEAFKARMAWLYAERERAVAAGDGERANELKAAGKAQQELLHAQVFAGGPIDDIMAMIRDDLPAVAKAAGVDSVIVAGGYAGPGATFVDVTDDVVRLFEPTAKTLRLVEQLRKTKPVTHVGDH